MRLCHPPTCVDTLQVVAAQVEQLEVFGQQELLGPEMVDVVPGQIHLHDVRGQAGRDVIQSYKKTGGTKRHWLVHCKDAKHEK